MDQIRSTLAGEPHKKERKMFGKQAFLVCEKLCLAIGKGELLVRFDPKQHETILHDHPCRPVQMRGRTYNGYVYVPVEQIRNSEALAFWVDLALRFNRRLVKGEP